MIQDELEPLITRCPNCGTRFRVTESQLAVAAGRVRCGACLTVFEGTEHLLIGGETIRREADAGAALDELLDELDDSDGDEGSVGSRSDEGLAQADEGPPAVSDLDAEPQIYGGFEEEAAPQWAEQALDEEDAEAWVPSGDAHESEDRDIVARRDEPDEPGAFHEVVEAPSTPVEVPGADTADDHEAESDEGAVAAAAATVEEDGPGEAGIELLPEPEAGQPSGELAVVPPAAISFAPEPRRWWVGAVAALFLLALVGQVLYFQMPTWSRDPGLRPIYAAVCRWLSCELPAMRDLNRMSARNLVVRSHPDVDTALIVDAVIVNHADYAQPFPDLELRFTAVGGLLVAGRRFSPEEYLVGEEVDGTSMPPDTPVQVSLEIEDPGPDAVNYVLKFR